MNLGVSIVICCYNSATRLPPTIEHLAKQEVDNNIPWEIIIVDNNSTDTTRAVVQTEWQKYNSNTPFKIVDQPVPGLAAAREKGISQANYEYLLFCDDDNWLCKDYINLAFQTLESNKKIAALGGCGIPVFEASPPAWFIELDINYATGPQAKQNGRVDRKMSYVYGAGSIYRKSALLLISQKGFKSMLSGRIGKKQLSSEDVELGYALTLCGYEIWYNENLLFKHFIPKSRLTWPHVKKHYYGHGASRAYLRPYQKALFNVKYSLLRDILSLLKEIAAIPKYYIYQKYRKKHITNICLRMGEINAFVFKKKGIKKIQTIVSTLT